MKNQPKSINLLLKINKILDYLLLLILNDNNKLL